MGKATGFLDYQRQTGVYRPVEERVKDYREVYVPLPRESLVEQGARCMDCGIPFCHSLGCPVYNLIPEWNDLVYRGKWRDALTRLEMTNNLPEITGRICPAPCETSCTMAINMAPVTIKQLECAIVEEGWEKGWIVPRPPERLTGKRVAVIGSGPAGLAAAQQLRRSGHEVVLYERSDRIGGILRYGIPDFKLEKWVIDRRMEQMAAEGVVFETNIAIGEDISANYLRRRFDAVVLTMGAGQPRDLQVPGREQGGIHFAMDYLTMSNRMTAGDVTKNDIVWAEGKNVLVIGGGDTGSDCVGTANRQGAKKVYQFEIMPRPREWDQAYNPEWPDWPRILRTSSSHEEGCERRWNITTKSFRGSNGLLSGVECAEVEWRVSGKGGRPSPVDKPDSGFSIDVDLVLLAMGFVHVEKSKILDDFGISYDPRGNIKVDSGYRTAVPGVFAAGDAGTGASLVVRAIFHGRKAAENVNEFLKK